MSSTPGTSSATPVSMYRLTTCGQERHVSHVGIAARCSSARLVDLLAQLVRDLCFLGLHHLSNHGHEILPTLRPGIGSIKIVKRDILWAPTVFSAGLKTR
jgi:hypothetical protein